MYNKLDYNLQKGTLLKSEKIKKIRAVRDKSSMTFPTRNKLEVKNGKKKVSKDLGKIQIVTKHAKFPVHCKI